MELKTLQNTPFGRVDKPPAHPTATIPAPCAESLLRDKEGVARFAVFAGGVLEEKTL